MDPGGKDGANPDAVAARPAGQVHLVACLRGRANSCSDAAALFHLQNRGFGDSCIPLDFAGLECVEIAGQAADEPDPRARREVTNLGRTNRAHDLRAEPGDDRGVCDERKKFMSS